MNLATLGKIIVLPLSFVGGVRYIIQNYQDATTIFLCWLSNFIYHIRMQSQMVGTVYIWDKAQT